MDNNHYICIMGIKDFPNYRCDRHGNVFSKRKMLKQSYRNGYLCVSLCNKGLCKSINVHRIIALAFIPNPDKKKEVNHINGIKTDNRVENLEWVTRQENNKHAVDNGLTNYPTKNREDLSKPVIQLNMNNLFLHEYPSANEASRQTGLSVKWICACANGGTFRVSGGKKKWVNCNSNGGFKWKYKTEIQNL